MQGCYGKVAKLVRNHTLILLILAAVVVVIEVIDRHDGFLIDARTKSN